MEFAYQLHPEQKPKAIDLQLTDIPDKKSIGQKLLGIYQLQDDNLKICYSDNKRPPTSTLIKARTTF